jgi:predicted porin
MKKTLIAAAVMAASGVAFAASNVTLYGVMDGGVVVSKAKKEDTKVQAKSGFNSGSRWGLKGVEELGNGYTVGFQLEQGFNLDDGMTANGWSIPYSDNPIPTTIRLSAVAELPIRRTGSSIT